GNFLGEFRIAQRLRAIQLLGFARVLAAGQGFGRDGRNVARSEEADAGVAHGDVEHSLRANGGRVVGQHVLVEAVGAENGKGNFGGLELVFHGAVPAGKRFAVIAGTQGGKQDDMLHAGGSAGVNHVPFHFDELRNRRTDQKNAGNALEHGGQRQLLGKIGDDGRGSSGSFGGCRGGAI